MHINAIPTREADRRLFLQNIVDVIDEVEKILGVPVGTYKALKDEAQAELDAYDVRDKARTAAATAETDLKIQTKAAGKVVRDNLKEIKNKVAVPARVLDLLQLNTANTNPQAKVKAEVPILKTRMKGIQPAVLGAMYRYDAMDIWCCRADETEYTFLMTITSFPFIDDRDNAVFNKAEQRNFKGYYKKKNVVVSAEGPSVPLLVPGGAHK